MSRANKHPLDALEPAGRSGPGRIPKCSVADLEAIKRARERAVSWRQIATQFGYPDTPNGAAAIQSIFIRSAHRMPQKHGDA